MVVFNITEISIGNRNHSLKYLPHMKTPYVFFLSEEKLTSLVKKMSLVASLAQSGVTDFLF